MMVSWAEDDLETIRLGRELFFLEIFAAHCYSDHSAAIYALAALGRLRDDCPSFKREIIPIGQNTDDEVCIAQLDFRCLIVQADDHGDQCLWRS